MRSFAALWLLVAASVAVASPPDPYYHAQDTLRRAHIGVYSRQLQEPVQQPSNSIQIQTEKPGPVIPFRCYFDPSKKLNPTLICEGNNGDSKKHH